jgi:hypothetical protein
MLQKQSEWRGPATELWKQSKKKAYQIVGITMVMGRTIKST